MRRQIDWSGLRQEEEFHSVSSNVRGFYVGTKGSVEILRHTGKASKGIEARVKGKRLELFQEPRRVPPILAKNTRRIFSLVVFSLHYMSAIVPR